MAVPTDLGTRICKIYPKEYTSRTDGNN